MYQSTWFHDYQVWQEKVYFAVPRNYKLVAAPLSEYFVYNIQGVKHE